MIPYYSTELALNLREIVNVFIAVFSFSLVIILTRYLWIEIKTNGWRVVRDEPFGKAAGALLLLSIGEFIRSTTIWEILHFDGESGNYGTQIVPLIVALTLVTIGSLCLIRIFTPADYGRIAWVLAMAGSVCLALLSLFWR